MPAMRSNIIQSFKSLLILLLIIVAIMYLVILPSHQASTFNSIIRYEIIPIIKIIKSNINNETRKLPADIVKQLNSKNRDSNIDFFSVDENAYIIFYIADIYEGLVIIKPRLSHNKTEWICISSLKIKSGYGSICTPEGGVVDLENN